MQNKKSHIPLLSIIVCCYNVSQYINTFMKSLLTQTYTINDKKYKVLNSTDIEIILIEDSSNDNGKTLDLCSKYNDQYTNILLIKNKSNKGLSASRNLGVKKATGKFITFPDPDDELNNGIINKYVNEINNSNFDVLCTGLIEKHFNKNNEIVLNKTISPAEKIIKGKNNIAKETVELEKQILFGYAWNKIYKKEIIDSHSLKFLLNVNYIEDILFNIAFYKKSYQIKTISDISVIYNRRLSNQKSITAAFDSNYFQLHYLRVEALYSYWKSNKAINDESLTVLASLYFRYAISSIWRNNDKKSGMSYKQQKNWIMQFYELELTKILLPYFNSKSLKNIINKILFNKKNIMLLITEAKLISFVDKNLNNLLIKLRQER